LVALLVQQILTPGSLMEPVVSRVADSWVTFLGGAVLFFFLSSYVVRRLSADPTGVPLIIRSVPVLLFMVGALGVAVTGHYLATSTGSDGIPLNDPQGVGYVFEFICGLFGVWLAVICPLGIFCGKRTIRIDIPATTINGKGIGPFAWADISSVKVIGSEGKPRLFLMLREPGRLLGRMSPFPLPTRFGSALGLRSARNDVIFDAELRSATLRSATKAGLVSLIQQYEPADTELAAEQMD
jgi:hypothetical protein